MDVSNGFVGPGVGVMRARGSANTVCDVWAAAASAYVVGRLELAVALDHRVTRGLELPRGARGRRLATERRHSLLAAEVTATRLPVTSHSELTVVIAIDNRRRSRHRGQELPRRKRGRKKGNAATEHSYDCFMLRGIPRLGLSYS